MDFIYRLSLIRNFDVDLDSLEYYRLYWYHFAFDISGNPISNNGILLIMRFGDYISERIFGLEGETKTRVFNNSWSNWK